MSFVIDGITDLSDVNNINVINIFNINKNINVYDYIFVNNFNNMYSHNLNFNVEICSLKVNLKDISIKKIDNKSTYIYCINFIYILDISISINSKFEQFRVKDMHSISFIYKNLDETTLNLLPINLDVKILDNRIGIGISLIIYNNEQTDTYKNKSMTFNNESCDDFLKNINYSYIDTSEEFI